MQRCRLHQGERVGGCLRMDTALIEHFVGDPIADACQKRLVQQQRLDGQGSHGQSSLKLRQRHHASEGVGTKSRQTRQCIPALHKSHAAESARVCEGQPDPV